MTGAGPNLKLDFSIVRTVQRRYPTFPDILQA